MRRRQDVGVTWVAAVAALIVGVAGCGSPNTGLGSGGELTEPGAGATGPFGEPCEGEGYANESAPPTTPLPADSVLVSATRCIYSTQLMPGDGEWLMRVEQKATSGLEGLATALRLPSQEASPGQACPAIGYLPIIITVTDTTGRSMHPDVPHAACGAPLDAATNAIAALPWEDVSTTKVQQTQS